jgi:hypothetical protein
MRKDPENQSLFYSVESSPDTSNLAEDLELIEIFQNSE